MIGRIGSGGPVKSKPNEVLFNVFMVINPVLLVVHIGICWGISLV